MSAAENGHGPECDAKCDGCLMLLYVTRAEKAEAEARKFLDKANALHPDQFKTGQAHLSPAFREIDYRLAFTTLAEMVNEFERALDVADPERSNR